MEKAQNVNVVSPVDIGWSDIGSWDSIRDRAIQKNNLIQGEGDIIQIECNNTLIRSDGLTIAAIGLKDLIIVATNDALLISNAGKSQEVKQVVDELKKRQKTQIL